MGEQTPAVQQPQLDLQIEKDGMSATLELKGRCDARFQYEDVIELLNDYHIIFGTDISLLKKLIRDFEQDQSPEKIVRGIVARGEPSIPAVNGKIIYHLKESPKVSIDEHGKADFRNIRKYLTVEPGQAPGPKNRSGAGQTWNEYLRESYRAQKTGSSQT